MGNRACKESVFGRSYTIHWVSCFIVEFSNPDTNWGEESVTFSEVPSFERLYKSGILPVGKGALFREMSSSQGSF